MINCVEYYILEDGRIWSIGEAKFVESMPDGSISNVCRSDGAKSSLDVLAGCLELYGLPKGELKTDSEYAAKAREKRDALLAETDFMMMPDYPLSEERRQAVAAYRQLLRDVPAQSGFPRQIDWPVKP